MTYTDGLLQRLRALTRCEHSDLSIGDEAADEIERLRAEVADLRIDAAMDGSIAADDRHQRTHFTAEWRAEKARADRAESELAALRQAVWDARAILGFDNGGDPTPDALAQPTLAELVLRDAREFRKDYDEACDEAAALRGRIAAAPVVCIDNGACVTDGARLTIAGGDTYFAHAELCGKRVRLVVDEG